MNTQACPEGEKVGVVRIKVVVQRLRATAVVGSFFSIDKLLHGWCCHLGGKLDCQFEIAYRDGRTISGTYCFHSKGGSRPALMPFVRASVQALEHYDTEDFAGAAHA